MPFGIATGAPAKGLLVKAERVRIDPWAAGYYWVVSARDAHFAGDSQPRTWRVVAVPSGVMPHSDRATSRYQSHLLTAAGCTS